MQKSRGGKRPDFCPCYFFGTYVIDDAGKTLTFKVQNSSFANFNGTERKFAVTLAGDELMVSNTAGASGGSANLTWNRVR